MEQAQVDDQEQGEKTATESSPPGG